jgi:very-short-patch-repair endonuclease
MRHSIIPYNSILKERARILRKNMTRGEVLLWTKLSRKQMCGYDFDRQRPIDNYIVDFYCKDLRLAIEIDGWSHAVKGAVDVARQKLLEGLDIQFLRFTEQEVLADLQSVADQIEMWIQRETPGKPTPSPSRGGEQDGRQASSRRRSVLGPARGGKQMA